MGKIMKRTWAVVLSLALLAELFVTTAIPAEAAAKKYVTGIKVAKSKVTLAEGKNTKINVTVKVKGNVKKTIKVKSSSSAVKVKAGKVSKKGVTPITITAKKAGKATITVTTVGRDKKNKKLSKTIKVTVKAKKKPTPTATKKPTATNTPVPTATNTPVPTATNTPVPTVSAESGRVYYLNNQIEVAEVWKALAAKYKEETGVEVKVVTAAAGTYDQTLESEVLKRKAPTLFEINGTKGYQLWKDYCMDLSGTQLYDWLWDKSMAVTEGDGVYGIPYAVEGYGIIYNDKIMRDYFALADKAVDISSAAEIKNFDTLKAVVEDMQAKKEQLGIEGVFASTSLKAGETLRWATHLANLPIYYEFKDKGVSDAQTIELTYGDNYKNIFDLYINNSCTDKAELGTKKVIHSMQEFALGKVAMIQNGSWVWEQITSIDEDIVAAEDVKFLPIYTGVAGEEKQGLCIGSENFMCVNSQVSEADQQATLAFVEWVFSSDTGKAFVTEKLGIAAPFSTFGDDERPTDPLELEVVRYMEDSSLTSVSWNFTAFPSQTFKDKLGWALLDYCNGQCDWEAVKTEFVDRWASEKEASAWW